MPVRIDLGMTIMRLMAALGLSLAAIALPVAAIAAVSVAQEAAAIADRRIEEIKNRMNQWLRVNPDPARQTGDPS